MRLTGSTLAGGFDKGSKSHAKVIPSPWQVVKVQK